MEAKQDVESLRRELAEARERVARLESEFDRALDVIVRRDAELQAAERRIGLLEEMLEKNGIPFAKDE